MQLNNFPGWFSGVGATHPSNFGSILGSVESSKAFAFTNGVLFVISTGPSGPATLTNSVSASMLGLSLPGAT